ncbi:hypothetical protein B0H12DRAFT_287351 [Mycena haematopus]|nr:hypothetical protein B0H12DRAFT_287351 [Mycena haematopus]
MTRRSDCETTARLLLRIYFKLCRPTEFNKNTDLLFKFLGSHQSSWVFIVALVPLINAPFRRLCETHCVVIAWQITGTSVYPTQASLEIDRQSWLTSFAVPFIVSLQPEPSRQNGHDRTLSSFFCWPRSLQYHSSLGQFTGLFDIMKRCPAFG